MGVYKHGECYSEVSLKSRLLISGPLHIYKVEDWPSNFYRAIEKVGYGPCCVRAQHILKLWPVFISCVCKFGELLENCIHFGEPAKMKLEMIHAPFGRVFVCSFNSRIQLL